MSEEAKKLIGDTAPKKIEQPVPTSVSARKGDGSVWNNAGTWKEKDHTLHATLDNGCVDCGIPIFGASHTSSTLRVERNPSKLVYHSNDFHWEELEQKYVYRSSAYSAPRS